MAESDLTCKDEPKIKNRIFSFEASFFEKIQFINLLCMHTLHYFSVYLLIYKPSGMDCIPLSNYFVYLQPVPVGQTITVVSYNNCEYNFVITYLITIIGFYHWIIQTV